MKKTMIYRAFLAITILLMFIGPLGVSLSSAHFDPPAAHFAVFLSQNAIEGFTWPKPDGSQNWQAGESIDITVTIFDGSGGDEIYSDTQPTFLVPSEHAGYTWESKVRFDYQSCLAQHLTQSLKPHKVLKAPVGPQPQHGCQINQPQPPAVGRCEHRHASGGQKARDLSDTRRRVRKVLQHLAADHQIKGASRKRQPSGICHQ